MKYNKIASIGLITLSISFSFKSFAQNLNLVLNPSFETYNPNIIPILRSEIGQGNIPSWTAANSASPDYYNVDFNTGSSLFMDRGIPNNRFGDQLGQDSNGYAGFIAGDVGVGSEDYREYVSGNLSRPLNAGEEVTIEFYISLAENSQYKVDEIGIYFHNSTISTFNNEYLNETPQIVIDSSHLYQFAEWVLVSKTYTAVGGEQYITIGNFNPGTQTGMTLSGTIPNSHGLIPNRAYYYIDNISIEGDKEGNPTSIENNSKESAFNIYPNPSTNNIKIVSNSILNDNTSFSIVDLTGKIVNQGNYSQNMSIDVSKLNKGVYVISLFKNGSTNGHNEIFKKI